MADPGSAVEVHDAAAVNGRASGRSAEVIVGEIERTRENLARTIDSLAERVSPANNLRQLRERGLEQVSRPQVQLAAAAVGLAVIGLAVYRIWSRRRR